MNQTRKIVILSFLIALEIILSRFLSISTPVLKIGFSFIPIAIAAIIFGTIYAGIASAIADFIGAILFPVGMYFPGFTLTAFLVGTIFGLCLHGEKNIYKITGAVVFVNMVLYLGLDTFWLHMITGNPFEVLVLTRVVKCVVMIPVQILVIYGFCYQLIPLLRFRTSGL